jgi:hypothetical protein
VTLALWEGLKAEGVSRRESARRGAGPTYRRALEERLRRWDAFGSLLATPSERAAFARLARGARRYVEEATYVGSPDLLESILLSVLLDLARRMPPDPAPERLRRHATGRSRPKTPRAGAAPAHSASRTKDLLPATDASALEPTTVRLPVPLRTPPALEATP